MITNLRRNTVGAMCIPNLRVLAIRCKYICGGRTIHVLYIYSWY